MMLERLLPPRRGMRVGVVLFEATARCDNACLYCYNAWKLPGVPVPRELPTDETLALFRRLADARGWSRPRQISFTGGEPLLRDDLETLVREVVRLGFPTNLITNGRRLDAARAAGLVAAGCRLFEIPLLAPGATEHDALAGVPGAFEGAVRAIGAARRAGARAVAAFVATRRNIDHAADVARLALALGADGLMFLRFNPGGAGAGRGEDLLPTPEQIVAALRALRAQQRGGLPVSISVPLPPCVVEPAETEGLGIGFCGAATDHTYIALAPNGDVRPCNHSPTVLGNLREASLASLLAGARYREFCDAVPDECRECPSLASCRCGCRAAAEACTGDFRRLEPLAARYGRFPWRDASGSSP
ncbi:MAG: radical SAM protein [Deltaproteobacteria bacterium]|nr:radical SAM protein [Deltaproteobacteria bacterium]